MVLEQTQQPKLKPRAENIGVRPATLKDSDGIARVFLESAEHHSSLDPALYCVPNFEIVKERYRTGRQHPSGVEVEGITYVADSDDGIVGFVDARLDRSTDAMHREMVFCHVIEIAVHHRFQRCGIGAQLLLAAEQWGRDNGANIALLEFHSANSQASSFYQRRMGYRVTSITVVKNL